MPYLLAGWLACASLQTATTAPATRRSTRSEFMIVAPRVFLDSLGDYARQKSPSLATAVVALEDLLRDSSGRDDPERLKRALFAAWRERGLHYVLLVGDADIMPVRYMVLDRVTPPAFDYAFYPSDLYYADLARADGEFDDWNARKDDFHADYFGEVRGEKNKHDPINYDHIDYKPEIAVGRWPVDTAAEVATLIQKSLRYEQSCVPTSNPPTAAFIAVDGWIDNAPIMDAISGRLPPGWRAEKRYSTPANLPAAAGAPAGTTPPRPTEEEVVGLLNSGVALMLHSGHGYDDGWDRCISVASLSKMHNADRLPVMLSAGCSTARFATLPPYEAYVDVNGVEHKGTNSGELFERPPAPPAPYQKGAFNNTGLGEQLLRAGPNGAAVYIGCNTGGQPCGMTLLAGFVESMHDSPAARVGDCWAGALRFYFDREHLSTIAPDDGWYPPSIFFQGMKYMFFGDPTLPIPRVTATRP